MKNILVKNSVSDYPATLADGQQTYPEWVLKTVVTDKIRMYWERHLYRSSGIVENGREVFVFDRMEVFR